MDSLVGSFRRKGGNPMGENVRLDKLVSKSTKHCCVFTKTMDHVSKIEGAPLVLRKKAQNGRSSNLPAKALVLCSSPRFFFDKTVDAVNLGGSVPYDIETGSSLDRIMAMDNGLRTSRKALQPLLHCTLQVDLPRNHSIGDGPKRDADNTGDVVAPIPRHGDTRDI